MILARRFRIIANVSQSLVHQKTITLKWQQRQRQQVNYLNRNKVTFIGRDSNLHAPFVDSVTANDFFNYLPGKSNWFKRCAELEKGRPVYFSCCISWRYVSKIYFQFIRSRDQLILNVQKHISETCFISNLNINILTKSLHSKQRHQGVQWCIW